MGAGQFLVEIAAGSNLVEPRAEGFSPLWMASAAAGSPASFDFSSPDGYEVHRLVRGV